MTIRAFEGFEGGVQGPFASSLTGTFSIQGTTKHTGNYALQVNPTTTNTGGITLNALNASGRPEVTATGFAVAEVYTSFYFRIGTLPDALDEEFFRYSLVDGTGAGRYRIGSDGTVRFYDDGNTLTETGTTVLSTGVWYKIEIRCSGTAIPDYELKIDGVSELSGTYAQTGADILNLRFGKTANSNGKTVDFYYDDIIIDDAAYPVDAIILAMTVNGDGSTQQWTSGTNGSDHQEVDEIPPDGGTTYVQCGTGGSQVSLFNLISCATAGISGTIHGAAAVIYIRENTSVTSSNSNRVRSGATNSDKTGFNCSTTLASLGSLHLVDPATSAAWTTGGLDAVEVGSIEANAVAMRMDAVFCEVLFIPGAAPAGLYRGFFALAGGA